MGIGFIAVGILFLCNPNINVFDVLPDCIGYCLIYHGLFRLSLPEPKLSDARDNCWKLALVTGVRILSFLLVPSASETYKLLMSFSFGVLEAFFFLPFAVGLFEGFYSLGTRFDAVSVFDVRTMKRKGGEVRVEYAERLKVFTIVFFCVKTVANVIPELTTLDGGDKFASNQRIQVPLIEYRRYLYLFFIPVVLFFGIVWLVRMVRWLNKIRRDEKLAANVEEYWRDHVMNDNGLVAAIRMKKVLLLLLCMAFGSLTFLLDGIDVIPNVLLAMFAVFAFASMLPYDRLSVIGIVLAAVTAVLSGVNMFLQIPYFEEYDAKAARFITNASVLYRRIRVLGTVEAILAMATVAFLFFIFCRVIRTHAGFIPFFGGGPQFSAEARRREVTNAVYARVLGAGIFGLLYFGSCIAYFSLAMYYEQIWILVFLLSIPWIVSVFLLASAAKEHLYDRLEGKY